MGCPRDMRGWGSAEPNAKKTYRGEKNQNGIIGCVCIRARLWVCVGEGCTTRTQRRNPTTATPTQFRGAGYAGGPRGKDGQAPSAPPEPARSRRHNNQRLECAHLGSGPGRGARAPGRHGSYGLGEPITDRTTFRPPVPSRPDSAASSRGRGCSRTPAGGRGLPSGAGVGGGRRRGEKGRCFPGVAGRRQAEGRGARTL